MTTEGDLVLVYVDNNPAFYARIESIAADVKPGWFHVRLLVLQVPLVVISWILKESYYSGEEFTMGGHPMRLEKVVAPPDPESGEGEEPEEAGEGPKLEPVSSTKKPAKVLSLFDRRKKDDGR